MKPSLWTLVPAIGVLISPVGAEACTLGNGCQVAVETLSSQSSDPFLFLGKVVDEEHPQWSRYKGPIEMYRSPLDCLKADERSSSMPDLTALDWDAIGTGRNAEVCIFRLLRNLKKRDDIIFWIEFQGFTTDGYSRVVSESFDPNYPTQNIASISGSWSSETYRQKNPSLLSRFLGIDFVQSYGVVVQLDQNDAVVGVHAGSISK